MPLVAGKIRSCFSMTEPDSPGSNPVILKTQAVSDGDDYVINGRKWYTTAADGASVAVVMAVVRIRATGRSAASRVIRQSEVDDPDSPRPVRREGRERSRIIMECAF